MSLLTPAVKARCAYAPYFSKLKTPADCIPFFKDGQYVAWGGFPPTGGPKVVADELAAYVERNNLQGKLAFHALIGATSQDPPEAKWAKNRMISHRFPYSDCIPFRDFVNRGYGEYADTHLSKFPADVLYGFYALERERPGIDIAIIEATEILEDGSLILSGGVGISPEACYEADKIIVELNTKLPSFKGVHDIVGPWRPPAKPLMITDVTSRIGDISVKVDPSKVVAVVESQVVYPQPSLRGADPLSLKIADNVLAFLQAEIKAGRFNEKKQPLQSGTGSISNGIIEGLAKSPLSDLTLYSEVIQGPFVEMIGKGQIRASSSTQAYLDDTYGRNFEDIKKRMVLRQQLVSNNPEVIRRLGVFSMNTPIEFDIYGHVNSSHIDGTYAVSGLGGSGDFARNAYISIMHLPSARKSKKDPFGVSGIVPMCTHIDHTEHDMDVFVTEQGVADIRGLGPVSRARSIIANCAHPSYRDQLTAYLDYAIKVTQSKGRGHEPQVLAKVFKMHNNLAENGTMHFPTW
jgi:acetyl-CoA hydrolase